MNKKFIGAVFVVISLVMIVSGSYIYMNVDNIENKIDNNLIDKNNNTIVSIDFEEANGKVIKEEEVYRTDIEKKYDFPSDNNMIIPGVTYDEENNKLIFVNTETEEKIGEYTCQTTEKGNNYCNVVSVIPTTEKYNLEENILKSQQYTPIIDNRYVLLKDSTIFDGNGLSHSKENPIILYDLEQSKELARYTGIKDNSDYNNSILIVKDNNNHWGLISIKDGVVTTILKFEYEYIGTLNGLYMAVKDNLYYIYNPKTTKLIGSFSNEISSMNDYFIVTNQGSYKDNTETNYRLYTSDGKKLIINQGNRYIELIDNIALVVDSTNMISIYKSDGSKLTENTIPLYKDTYHSRENTLSLAYNTTLENDILTIEVNDKDQDMVTKTYQYNILTGEIVS